MNLKYDKPLSNFAFSFNVRLYSEGGSWGGYLQWDEGVSVVCVEPAPKETNRR